MVPDLLKNTDPDMARAIENEWIRQQTTLELICSENIASRAVMAAQGSLLTNKYAEGYPRKRYYGGCEFVDVAESLAIERACDLFSAPFANVQPHSGSQANMAAYFALLDPGDTILGMNLSHGGHLTHGSPVSFSGRLFNFVHYGVRRDTGTIDYDQVADLAKTHRPKMIVAGASAYPRIFDFQTFADIAQSVDAYFMVDMAHIAGLVAAHVHPSPIDCAHVVTTTTHKTLRGPRGGMIFAKSDLGKAINSQIFPGIQGGPLMHVIAAKAVALKEAMTPDFAAYQVQVVKNAAHLAAALSNGGLELVSGGTDNHLMLVDLRNKNIAGKDAEAALDLAGITVNKNSIPFDDKPPSVTSGIRIGTPNITTRGMKEAEMDRIAAAILQVLDKMDDTDALKRIRADIQDLCRHFPLYPEARGAMPV